MTQTAFPVLLVSRPASYFFFPQFSTPHPHLVSGQDEHQRRGTPSRPRRLRRQNEAQGPTEAQDAAEEEQDDGEATEAARDSWRKNLIFSKGVVFDHTVDGEKHPNNDTKEARAIAYFEQKEKRKRNLANSCSGSSGRHADHHFCQQDKDTQGRQVERSISSDPALGRLTSGSDRFIGSFYSTQTTTADQPFHLARHS